MSWIKRALIWALSHALLTADEAEWLAAHLRRSRRFREG